MSGTKTVVGNIREGAPINVETETDLPNGGLLRLYGNVDGDIDDIGDNGQPTGFTFTVGLCNASYWPSATAPLAEELGSLEAVVAATGMTAEELGAIMVMVYNEQMEG